MPSTNQPRAANQSRKAPAAGATPLNRLPRLGFAGTPEFAATILEALIKAGHLPAVVYTQPDRPSGRGRKIHPSPVKALALAHDIEVRQPSTLKPPSEATALADLELDLLIVAAYGLILPPAVLAVPRLGCINVHASLLPRWRGAAPIERAILAGDRETGVCIMRMEQGLDTGPILAQQTCEITEKTTAVELEARLAELGSSLLIECLERLDTLIPIPQPEQGVTYASKLEKGDAEIDWSRSAASITRQVQALADRLPPFTYAGDVRLSVLEAEALHDRRGANGRGAPADQGADDAPAGLEPAGTIIAADARGIRVACGSGVLNIARLKLSIGKGQALRAADAINGYRALFHAGSLLVSKRSAP